MPRTILVVAVDDEKVYDVAGKIRKLGGEIVDDYPEPQDAWGEDSDYPRTMWQNEVASGDTNLGYWGWVNHQVQMDF